MRNPDVPSVNPNDTSGGPTPFAVHANQSTEPGIGPYDRVRNQQCSCGNRLTRRALVTGSGAAVAATAMSSALGAQEATPAGLDLDAFRALCEWVTGIDPISDDAGLVELLALMGEDEQFRDGLADLATMDRNEALDARGLGFPAVVAMTGILQYWYLGNFRNEPLANRDERFPQLLSWQALPYATHQTVCKGFGYWETELELPDRD